MKIMKVMKLGKRNSIRPFLFMNFRCFMV